MKENLLNKT